MRCKIVKFQKLIWRNMMRSTKNQKTLVLYCSIDDSDIFAQRKIPNYPLPLEMVSN